MMIRKIPRDIDDNETIFRNVYSPIHIDTKKHKVRPSALQPNLKNPDEDDKTKVNNKASTTRKDYASLGFCKNHALNHENGRKFAGFLSLTASKIREVDADVVAKPVEDNPAHANIVFESFDIPFGEEIDPLYKAELKAVYTELTDSGTYVDLEEVERLLDEDSKLYPESGVFDLDCEEFRLGESQSIADKNISLKDAEIDSSDCNNEIKSNEESWLMNLWRRFISLLSIR